jgi:Fic family protein
MDVTNYRVEKGTTKKGTIKYFLVKDVKVGKKIARERRYIKSGDPPTAEELQKFSKENAIDIEVKALNKAAKLSSSRYIARYLSKEEVSVVERIRYLYKAFTNTLTTNELKKYEKDFEISYVSGTTSIEGNTLSLKETYDLLINDIVPKEKSAREINEVQNFKRVLAYREKYHGRITIKFIKNLHGIIVSNIDYESAGSFRRSDFIGISGCDLRVTPYFEIEDELKRAIDDYYNNIKRGSYPFEEAILFHYRFEMIHPFIDGNGRVGRELLNYLLIRNRPPYPKLLFLGKDRPTYIQALKLGNEEKYKEMVNFFVDLIIKQRLDVLRKNFEMIMETETRPKGQLKLTDFVNI